MPNEKPPTDDAVKMPLFSVFLTCDLPRYTGFIGNVAAAGGGGSSAAAMFAFGFAAGS